ncbi:E3 SUMO-protein ligase Nse2 (Mms21) [Macleaya cordata]|uniref:E3 SUMO-protein ligase Nse2 (Mms21) n=1 Tax=Macleaya cordata TaxID=56857 RepID=A0A200QLC3_MACCD|nr:E3 SUMO-protein ligase Nse2 (Mms21) [Macleaya cordata]
MASTSARQGDGGVGRIRTAVSTLYSDNQSLIAEFRKLLSMMKGIAVDLEKENQSQRVKELEDAVVELLASSDDCTHFSSALQSVGDSYQPGEGVTDFKKLLEEEFTKLKASAPLVPQNHPFLRQFKEAIWNVHHAGEPMPGDEQEDIIMTSTQSNILNIICPLSGKPVIELADPVRSMDCKHIYEKKVVMHYIRTKNSSPQCPVAGCPKILQAGRVVCDPLLLIEIDEMRSINNQTVRPSVVEDFTELDEEE